MKKLENTGTYLDSPFHRFQEGKDISELDLSGLAELEMTDKLNGKVMQTEQIMLFADLKSLTVYRGQQSPAQGRLSKNI